MQKELPHLRHFLDLESPVTELSSKDVVSVSDWDRVRKAINMLVSDDKVFYKQLDDKHIKVRARYRRLAVVSAEGHIMGFVTVTDVLNYLGAGEKHGLFGPKHGLDAIVANIMSNFIYTIDKNHKIGQAIPLFKKFRHGAYPVTEGAKLHSILSESDMIKTVNRTLDMEVGEIMVRKPIHIKEDHSIRDVTGMMCNGGFRRLPVVNKGIIMGIATPYDVLSYLYQNNKLETLKAETRPISSIMTKNPITIGQEEDVYDALVLMRDYNVGGLPVTKFDELVGIITERDILEALI